MLKNSQNFAVTPIEDGKFFDSDGILTGRGTVVSTPPTDFTNQGESRSTYGMYHT